MPDVSKPPSGVDVERNEDSASKMEDREPSVIGAAPTVPFRRETRAERAERLLMVRSRAVPDTDSDEALPTHRVADDGATIAEYSVVEHVFEPHYAALPPLRQYLRSVWHRRRFMRELAKASLHRERSGRIMGTLWGILDPLITAAIYFFVFTVIREGARPTEFIPILIAGIILFQMMMTVMNTGAASIKSSSNLMLNSTFPRVLLPLSVVYRSLLKAVPVVPVYAIIYVVAPTTPGWSLLLFPLLFAIQVVLMTGLALFTSTLVVYFRDVQNTLNYASRVLFFMTPVIYPVSFVPDDIRKVLSFQPMFALFAAYQEILTGQFPPTSLILQAGAWATGFFLVGGWMFLRHEGDFANQL